MSAWDQLAAFWLTQWDVHPDRSLLLAGIGLAYVVGLGLRGRLAHERVGTQPVWFLLGLGLLALAVQSPLHHLADRYLFSAHMVQHLLLTLVVPPLFLMGTPGWLVRPLFDPPWFGAPLIRRFGKSPAYTVSAFVVFNLLFSFIHLPTLYDAAFSNELVHFTAHAVFLVTGLWTWMPLLSPIPEVLPRLPLPGQMLYCFFQTIPSTLVGSLVTLSDGVVYQHYGVGPLQLGVDPLADQQVGGLLMWVVGGTFFLLLMTVLFFIWADREQKAEPGG
ncbi:MAG: cytochrome c oxidase assembly protein [Chloroflexi bacterium]|nr:cytochrome c oxidase assembly protein [Chloroflexota bacterium]